MFYLSPADLHLYQIFLRSCSVDLVVLLLNLHVTETICSAQLNLDRLLARMWEEMGLVRVYTKPQGQQPDFTDPVVLSTVCSLPLYGFSPVAVPTNRGEQSV